jgi:hypothetical protein
MARKKRNYQEGDWFAVPLRDGGYAVGLVARADGRGSLLGYFFGPRHEQVPSREDVHGLSPATAIYVAFTTDPGLLNESWPVINRPEHWDRSEWPMPVFGRINAVGKAWRVEYDDSSLNEVCETPVRPHQASRLPQDGLDGYGATEIYLTHLLSGGEGTDVPGRRTRRPIESWMEELFGNDVALDAQALFERAVRSVPPERAAEQVLRHMEKTAQDTSEGPVLLLALATLLLDRGVQDHEVLRKAREVRGTGKGLERWREAGPAALAKRQALYDQLGNRLP